MAVKQVYWLQSVSQQSIEKVIIDRMITTWDSQIMALLLIKKVDETYFSVELYRNIFIFIREVYSKTSTLPSESAIETQFNGYICTPIKDDISDQIDQLIYFWTIRKNKEIISQLNQSLNEWVVNIQAINDLQEVNNIVRSVKEEGYFVLRSEDFVKKTEELSKHPDEQLGLQVGIKYLDEEFLWIRPTDFIWILADEKVGKSWITLWMAYELVKWGKNILFISPEMDSDEVQQRLHLLHMNFNSKQFYKWELDPQQFTQWRQKNSYLNQNRIAKKGWEIFIIDDIELADLNITTIKARLKKLDQKLRNVYIKSDPNHSEYYKSKSHFIDLIIIDWFHLMNGTDLRKWASEWKESQLISQGLRSFARIEKVPIVISLHTNRDKQKAEERLIPDWRDTSFTASLWRDLTCLLSLFATPAMNDKKKIWMACTLSRRSPKWRVWQMDFDPENGIIKANHEILTQKEFEDRQSSEQLWWPSSY